jgi:hypothetical protein
LIVVDYADHNCRFSLHLAPNHAPGQGYMVTSAHHVEVGERAVGLASAPPSGAAAAASPGRRRAPVGTLYELASHQRELPSGDPTP